MLGHAHATQARAFVLEELEQATRIKLFSFPKAPGKKPDQAYLYSSLGIRYLTLFVRDLNPILARAKKAGVSALGETPVKTNTGTWLLALKDPDGNNIEVIGPRH